MCRVKILGNSYVPKTTRPKVIGFKGEYEFDLNKPIGMMQKLLDVQKIRSLGWKPRYSLQLGLEKAYNYYMNISNFNK